MIDVIEAGSLDGIHPILLMQAAHLQATSRYI